MNIARLDGVADISIIIVIQGRFIISCIVILHTIVIRLSMSIVIKFIVIVV
jgi:hypothetical protein